MGSKISPIETKSKPSSSPSQPQPPSSIQSIPARSPTQPARTPTPPPPTTPKPPVRYANIPISIYERSPQSIPEPITTGLETQPITIGSRVQPITTGSGTQPSVTGSGVQPGLNGSRSYGAGYSNFSRIFDDRFDDENDDAVYEPYYPITSDIGSHITPEELSYNFENDIFGTGSMSSTPKSSITPKPPTPATPKYSTPVTSATPKPSPSITNKSSTPPTPVPKLSVSITPNSSKTSVTPTTVKLLPTEDIYEYDHKGLILDSEENSELIFGPSSPRTPMASQSESKIYNQDKGASFMDPYVQETSLINSSTSFSSPFPSILSSPPASPIASTTVTLASPIASTTVTPTSPSPIAPTTLASKTEDKEKKSEKLGNLRCLYIRLDKKTNLENIKFIGSHESPIEYILWDGEKILISSKQVINIDESIVTEINFGEILVYYPNLNKFVKWLDEKFIWEDQAYRCILIDKIKAAENILINGLSISRDDIAG